MKDWFPLTNYDFYAYLTAGMVVLAAYDRVFLGSTLADQQNWTVVGGVFWAAVAYLIGQIVAIPSSALLEHWLARRVLHAPAVMLLGFSRPRKRERMVIYLFGAREYEPFPSPNQSSILEKLAAALKVDRTRITAEAAFQCAFPYARSILDSSTRLDTFLNQYGMCRNVAFAAILAGAILTYGGWHFHGQGDFTLGFGALILAVGLFGRFIKFYAAYAREIFRTFDKLVPPP